MVSLLSSVVVVLLCSGPALCQEQPGPPDICPQGDFQKDEPSPEPELVGACQPWRSSSCCITETSRSLDRALFSELYNFTLQLCGNFSDDCATYMQSEACFYECEPMLQYFETTPGKIARVPVCGSYCDRWFDACKNDMTCPEDFETSFIEGRRTCPAGMQCTTFAEQYGDARGFCNALWQNLYFYSEDEDNCTVLTFDPDEPNPNFDLTFGGGKKTMAAYIAITAAALLQFIMVY